MGLRLIFLGPQGSGKGTQASRLARLMGVPHVSTGEMLRQAVADGTELGKKADAIMQAGDLVPDELVVAMVGERLSQDDAACGYILDGFPRTIPQAEALDSFERIDAAIELSIGDEQVVKRLSGRRVCRQCGQIYHVATMPPRMEGVCDACGGELYTRDDDKPEAIKNRLDVYRRQTEPLISYYEKAGKLEVIDSSTTPESSFEQLSHIIRNLG